MLPPGSPGQNQGDPGFAGQAPGTPQHDSPGHLYLALPQLLYLTHC
jgi:hypothetical protein